MTRDYDHWTETLKAFTLRNAGRATILEVEELEIGAQREATLMDLKGASFDPHGSRVGLMLGSSAGAHLTHAIPGVTRIDVLEGDGTREEVLRIEHPGGQALLRVLPSTPAGSD